MKRASSSAFHVALPQVLTLPLSGFAKDAAIDSDVEIFLKEDSVTSTRPRFGRICHSNVEPPQKLMDFMLTMEISSFLYGITYLDKHLVQIHRSDCNA